MNEAPVANEHSARQGQDGLSKLFVFGERLRTQDNRITSNPMFCVQEKKREHGFDRRWCETTEFVFDGEVVPMGTPGAEEIGYRDRWVTVMVAFTEAGCEEYLRLNGHNHLGETRIYVESWNRCPEMIAIREYLIALTSVHAGGNG